MSRIKRSAFLVLLFQMLYVSSPLAGPPSACTVTKVIDGDTIYCVPGEVSEISVRLIGIDSPELTHHPKMEKYAARTGLTVPELIEQGKRAKMYVESLLSPGDSVNLELDIDPADGSARTLAYVWLTDGTMLNELLVREGFAIPLTVYPNVKYQALFLRAELDAIENRRGLWHAHSAILRFLRYSCE